MTDILKKTSSFIFRFHRIILISSSILTILTTILILRMDIKTDILDALPAKNPAIDKFVNFLTDFGSMDNLIVALKSKDKKADEYLELAEYLGKKLEDSPLIEYADYNILQHNKEVMTENFTLFIDKHSIKGLKERLTPEGIEKQIKQNKKKLLSPVSTPLDMELILNDPLNIRSLMLSSILRQGGDKINVRHGYYISSDNSMLLIFAKPAGSSRDIGFVKRLKKEVDRILEDIMKQAGKDSDLQPGFAGPYAFAMEAHAAIRKDVIANALLSTILVFFLFQFVYKKRFFVLIVAAATLLAALSWTLGVAYLIFGDLNMASSVVTAMLMGLGIDYIIHIFNRCESEYLQSKDLKYSLDTALTKTAPAVIAGSATTSAAFFSIVTTSFKGLYQLGIVAGIGVFACLVSVLFIMTSLIIFIETRKQGLLFSAKEQRFGMEGISRIIKHYPKLIVFISIGILLISFSGLSIVRFDNNPESLGLKTSNVMRLEKEVSEHFGRQKNPLMITVTADNRQNLMEQYSKLENVLEEWKDKGVIMDYNSLKMFLPPLGKQIESISVVEEMRKAINFAEFEDVFKKALEENGFANNEQYTRYVRGIKKAMNIKEPVGLEALENITDKKVQYFYNKDKLKSAAYLFPKNGIWDDTSLSFIQKESLELGKEFVLTGTDMMFASLKTSIIRESILASIIAFTVIFFIIYSKFKSVKRVFLVKVPLLIGLTVTLGLMGLTGIQFNYINIGAITLLFGIGVDYGIYILQDYIEEKQKKTEASVRHAGKTIVMCAMTTTAGIGSLMTMKFQGIATLGAIITIGVVACLLCALFLLPVLIHYTEEL